MELQQMSVALPPDERDTQPDRSSLAVINEFAVLDDSLGPVRDHSSTFYLAEASQTPLPQTPSNSNSSTRPSLISSPPSLFEPNDLAESEKSTPSFIESYNMYRENNIRLSRVFPHLICVSSGSRHDKANITIFDYNRSALQSTNQFSIDFSPRNIVQSQDTLSSKLENCREFICSTNSISQVETRLVVVEDLGPALINLLGATFDLSPEFFEEHLHRSDYRGFKDPAPSPSTWRTSNLRKNYVSFAWSKPGESWSLGVGAGQWGDLYNQNPATVAKVTELEDKMTGQPSNVFHRFVAMTNISRSSTEISADPAGYLPVKQPCGWEERATACNVQFSGLRYGASWLMLKFNKANLRIFQ